MVDSSMSTRTPAALLTLATLGLAGCAHVSRSDFEAEMEQVRAEMTAGDEAVEDRLGSRVDGLESRMDRLEGALRTLQDELDVRIERLEGSLRVHTPLHFGFDSAELEEGQTPVLARLAGVLTDHYPGALLTVEGFTDPAGSAAYNLRLGQRRAEAVRGWLVGSGGFDEGVVRAVSYGESAERLVRPDEAGPGARGRENRRVVVVIDHPGVRPAAVVAGRGSEGAESE